MKALLVIDYTVDFVTGKLPVGQPALDIEERIAALTEEFVECGDYVVMAVDVHEENDPDHPETKLFPPHNIRGTEGRDLYGRLREVYENNKNRIEWMDKTRYSAFHETGLDEELKKRGIRELHLAGVCTDICVLHTAVDAYNKGYSLVIHRGAAASFNAAGHAWALEHFAGTLGAEITD
ncbi:isochorismatase family cysteine hydrolase [Paenibacillus aurantius]|uniref:Isochorismatase family cysteine hydrolase n=1 Tax=Paenibacillus aurantius TaxID=2918900 RepID=A0AA96LGV6_9BACL|nr:isochorismatase family cysteine hydrolase [Paenibacillus aurantius]WNQ11840.1 isochorismatase family cysteine hydrolase [Paenibacillus aurantius]